MFVIKIEWIFNNWNPGQRNKTIMTQRKPYC